MVASIWGLWSDIWLLSDKVSFDGASKIIYVHPEVTTLDIRADVYTSWVDWVVLNDNSKYLPAIRYTGYDPIGGGQFTGDSYFLTNGWKLSVDLAKVRVTGVLFSDNYDTAYYTSELAAQYPATVSALVNTVNLAGGSGATAEQVWAYGARTLSVAPPTAAQVATAVRGELAIELAAITSMQVKLDMAAAILKNKTVTNPVTGVMTVYQADGVTPLYTAQLYENVDGSVTYRGQGAERREALM